MKRLVVRSLMVIWTNLVCMYAEGSDTGLFTSERYLPAFDVAVMAPFLPSVHYRRIQSLLFWDATPFWDFFAA